MYGGANTTTPPSGWLWCTGGPVPPQYTNLISIIGNTLPDLRSRVPVGFGQGVGLINYPTMFGSGGNENSTLPSHTHTINDPTHSHGILSQGGGYAAADGGNGNRANTGGNSSSSSTGITINSEGVSAVGTNLPPYLVVNYIIKT
jgi:microcystin-dependent protein